MALLHKIWRRTIFSVALGSSSVAVCRSDATPTSVSKTIQSRRSLKHYRKKIKYGEERFSM